MDGAIVEILVMLNEMTIVGDRGCMSEERMLYNRAGLPLLKGNNTRIFLLIRT